MFSFVFSVFSWWWQNLGKKARAEALAAADEAQRRLTAVEAVAERLDGIEKQLAGPELSVRYNGDFVVLLNNTGNDIEIAGIDARGSIEPRAQQPFTITAHSGFEFCFPDTLAGSKPAVLPVRLRDGRTLRVVAEQPPG